jgi:hypothetical protein
MPKNQSERIIDTRYQQTASVILSGGGSGASIDTSAFLRRDGTLSLTGNLSVDPGITIDGVDLSTHAGNPSAHHAPVTVVSPIGLSGQEISLLLASNPGLEDVSGLRVKTGNGIGRDVTGVYVRKATDSGLGFDGGGALQLGTPTTLSAATANGVSGVSHVHAVDAVADVSTLDGVTYPQGRLLKSTAAGGLITKTLGVKGNVDITDGGDLTVGANVLFVDVSLDSVGILRAPDPQFALDVNGPIRGTELVGKHAIQLEDVALLCHFDGGEPYSSNYTGEPNAIPLGQVPTTNNNTHYRPGKFYKCVSVGPTGTNLITNPSFETNLTGWTAVALTAAVRDTGDAYFGIASAKLSLAGAPASNSQFYAGYSATNGDVLSFSVWLRANVPTTANLQIVNASTFANYGSAAINITEDWQRFSVTGTALATASVRLRILFTSGSCDVYVDGAQLELSATPTWYMDGSLPGHSWSGTAHASTSSRSNGSMAYALAGMVAHRWTVMAWCKWPAAATGSNQIGSPILRLPSGRVSVQGVSGTALRLNAVHNGGTSTPTLLTSLTGEQWYHVAIVYDNGTLRTYIDGELKSTLTSITFAGAPTSVDLGLNINASYGPVMVDDLCVARKALSSDRVRAIYESDAQVFAESSVFNFRATPKGLVWADEEGLWMRDTLGNPVLGVYGGEAASKSWGGATLSVGDILFGQYGASNGGWMWFDQDGVSGKPQWKWGYADKTVLLLDSGGATLDGVLDLSTNGGIYQGTGSFASPTTGLKIWNVSGIGRIAGYNAGVPQWYADTDGKFYAGEGIVQLGEKGIRVIRSGTMSDLKNSYGFVDGTDTWRGGMLGYLSDRVTTGNTNEVYIGAQDSSKPNAVRIIAYNADAHRGAWVGVGALSIGTYADTIYEINATVPTPTQIKHRATQHYWYKDDTTTLIAILDQTRLDLNLNVLRLRTGKTPASASAAGSAGDICWDGSYFYVCVATNTWRRAAHASW